MGVSSINGQGLAARVPLVAAGVSPREAPPSPGPRTAETVRDTAPPAARVAPGPSEGQTQVAANGHKQSPAIQRTGVRMHLDKASKRIVSQITNDLNEVIKQIPPEELMKVSARIRELEAVLFDRKV